LRRTIWVIPAVIAITFHEAAHGFVAYLLGDQTAWRLGRVRFNPVKHIDPCGTILLPGGAQLQIDLGVVSDRDHDGQRD
jgi:Zn-dependent protease